MGEAGHTVRQKRETKNRGDKLRIQTVGFCLSGVYFFVFARSVLFRGLDGARERRPGTAKSGHTMQTFVEPGAALLCVSLASRRAHLRLSLSPVDLLVLLCSLCSRV